MAFLTVYVLCTIGLNSSMTFYDAMLPDITTDERMDAVSSSGYAWGYIGSCIPFGQAKFLCLFHNSSILSKGVLIRGIQRRIRLQPVHIFGDEPDCQRLGLLVQEIETEFDNQLIRRDGHDPLHFFTAV